MKKNNTFDLIYSTCDEYHFLWNDFFRIFFKRWPSFDSTIISTGSKPVEMYPNIKTIKKSKSDIILFFLDDFFLTKDVRVDLFNKALSIIKSDKTIASITLFDHPSENEYGCDEYNDWFVVKKNDAKYCVTTQVSLWRKSYLLKVLHAGENAWEFEKLGSLRHQHYGEKMLYRKDEFKDIFSYPEGGVFQKGQLRKSPDVLKLVKDESIESSAYHSDFKQKKAIHFYRFRAHYRKFYLKHHVNLPWLPCLSEK